MNVVADFRAERAVLTLAMSKAVYFDLAVNLARSFLWWHRKDPIRFYLATDQVRTLPHDLRAIILIRLREGEFGTGFSPKLHLEKIAPAEHTLFVDADCLCVRNLTPVFDRFRGFQVGVVGGAISDGEWFGDVREICETFRVDSLPKFNGGVYYLEKGETARRVFAEARGLEGDYDDIGLTRLRGRPNDELLVAIAMARNGLPALPDDGSIMSDPQACPGPMRVSVTGGTTRLTNPPSPDPLHREWYPFTHVSPAIVHFLGDHHRNPIYKSEAAALALMARGAPQLIASALAKAFILFPGSIRERLKESLRPAFRRVFGIRSRKLSDRV